MSQRVARARELVAEGAQPTAVARVSRISRQSIYKVPKRRPQKAGPGEPGPDDARIVEIAKANPSDGTRMVAAIASRELGEPVHPEAGAANHAHPPAAPACPWAGASAPAGILPGATTRRVVAHGHDQGVDG